MEDILELLVGAFMSLFVRLLPERFRDWLAKHHVIMVIVNAALWVLSAIVCAGALFGLLVAFAWIINKLGGNIHIGNIL